MSRELQASASKEDCQRPAAFCVCRGFSFAHVQTPEGLLVYKICQKPTSFCSCLADLKHSQTWQWISQISKSHRHGRDHSSVCTCAGYQSKMATREKGGEEGLWLPGNNDGPASMFFNYILTQWQLSGQVEWRSSLTKPGLSDENLNTVLGGVSLPRSQKPVTHCLPSSCSNSSII